MEACLAEIKSSKQGIQEEIKATQDNFESWIAEVQETTESTQNEVQVLKKRFEERTQPALDYRRLKRLLESGSWMRADKETFNRILEIADSQRDGRLNEENIDQVLIEELRIIDQLWTKYSNGRFGFSVQFEIYQDLGGTQKYDDKIWKDFGNKVGWYISNQWIWYRYVNFRGIAPSGHLPARVWDSYEGRGVGSLHSLMPKLIEFGF
ncbi:GUN4 domain-containing protein [Kovacikia minuta CCNUW1]|uniref:GUN4 domain-containing protein n=1 Tax=Kovacikia minuta TaxID=2931930 RepID=UPI001CCD8C18|nr:GUN4 domain-containing protein [Kovacikia minuta]UBF28886.1 GUN4 domain-containing protein [Kovacikia minuta CCNUW1]